MKEASCFTCSYATITGDASVGIGDYVEDCNNYACGDAVYLLLEKVFDNRETIDIRGKRFYDNMEMEEQLPKFCGGWLEDPYYAHMEAEAKRMEEADNAN